MVIKLKMLSATADLEASIANDPESFFAIYSGGSTIVYAKAERMKKVNRITDPLRAGIRYFIIVGEVTDIVITD
jgi:hypothetical protein